MVGWSDYFDLKQAETAALRVAAVMKKRGRRPGASYFLFCEERRRSVGEEQHEAESGAS